MSQTGGGCRASNYVSLLRKALKDMGMEQIPVISVNMAGLREKSGVQPFSRRNQERVDGYHVRRPVHEGALCYETV